VYKKVTCSVVNAPDSLFAPSFMPTTQPAGSSTSSGGGSGSSSLGGGAIAGIVIAVIVVLIAAGAVYFMKFRKAVVTSGVAGATAPHETVNPVVAKSPSRVASGGIPNAFDVELPGGAL
jgi:hypothetical protein